MPSSTRGRAESPSVPGIRSSLRFVVGGRSRPLGLMTATAFIGGVAEAVFLVTVTRAAFAVTGGSDRVGVIASRFLSLNETLLLALGLVLLRIVAALLAAWQSARLSSHVVAQIRRRVARAFLDAEWKVQHAQRGGSLQELVVSYSGSATNMISSLNSGLVALANLTAMLGLALVVDPLGALVMVGSVFLLAIVLRPVRAAVRRRAHDHTTAGMELAVAVNEISTLGMELHVFKVQSEASDSLNDRIERTRRARRRLDLALGVTSPIYSGLAYMALLAALAVVSLSSAANLSSLGAVMLVMLRSLSYGQALQTSYVGVTSSVPALTELRRRLDLFENARRIDGGMPVERISCIAADHVTFSYDGEHDVLCDVSFTIEKREIVGIVGPSGGGKSTLVQLMLGLRDPKVGRVLVDGRDLRDLDKTQLCRRVTFVPQAAHFVRGSIADNIRFMRKGVSIADVEHAARLAHLHDDIVGFREGYERDVGDQGGHLSGGQQQRLCIARALVERPDVMIMDEPTSALDVKSEHLLRSTLVELRERMTIVVIAHRLSTLDICDRIMVIQDGELRGFDTPSNLSISSDFYREALELSGLR